MTGRDGYELDMSSPVSHVAAEMDRAAPGGAALTVKAMAATYQHPVSFDIDRIRKEEKLGSDEEAVLWLIRAAVVELGRQVTRDGDGYRLAKPFSELRWKKRPVRRPGGDEHARLGDPFNPMTGGIFAENVRIGKGHKSSPPEDDVLRESMRQNGWLPGHPAVADERGVVITGHRRLKIARELNIDPDIKEVRFGSGDAADIARLRAAWWSNEGVKSYTPGDRQAMAVYLRERGWPQASIAEALHVAQATISRDLEEAGLIIHVNNQDAGHGGARSGAGRPRKADKAELHNDIADRMDRGEDIRREELAARHGVGKNTVTRAVERERGRRDAPAPGSKERALQDILKILMGMSPDDRVWLLGQLPAMTP
jgi:ParB-like chromosome segregation protein Spo0J